MYFVLQAIVKVMSISHSLHSFVRKHLETVCTFAERVRLWHCEVHKCVDTPLVSPGCDSLFDDSATMNYMYNGAYSNAAPLPPSYPNSATAQYTQQQMAYNNANYAAYQHRQVKPPAYGVFSRPSVITLARIRFFQQRIRRQAAHILRRLTRQQACRVRRSAALN